jgi:hypothetical protein
VARIHTASNSILVWATVNKLLLKRHLNNFVDEGYAFVPAWSPTTYGEGKWLEINLYLAEWEAKGYLKVLKTPETCSPDELCIEMFNFIDAPKPLHSNWLSKTRLPPKWPHLHMPGTKANHTRSTSD